MPIPKPNPGEGHDHFLSRCMGNPTMVSEYPDAAQRYAVCQGQLKERAMPATMVRKRYFGKAISVDKQNLTLTVVMTTKRKDRDGDIVEPKGAVLTDWKENSVVLWAHDRKGAPIAKVLETLISDDMIMGTVKFDGKDPFAVLIFNKYVDGFLNAWSIGFKADQKGMEPLTNEEGVITGFHFKEWELLELSAVPVPSNPQALTRELEGMEKELRGRFVNSGMQMAKDCGCAELEKLFAPLVVKETPPPPAPEEVVHRLIWDKDGPRIYTGKEFTEEVKKVLKEGALKKSIEERGLTGKIPVVLELGEASSLQVDFTVINEKDGVIAEARILSAKFTLPNPAKSEAPTPPGPGRAEEKGAGNNEASTSQGAGQESSTSLEVLALEIEQLRVKASGF